MGVPHIAGAVECCLINKSKYNNSCISLSYWLWKAPWNISNECKKVTLLQPFVYNQCLTLSPPPSWAFFPGQNCCSNLDFTTQCLKCPWMNRSTLLIHSLSILESPETNFQPVSKSVHCLTVFLQKQFLIMMLCGRVGSSHMRNPAFGRGAEYRWSGFSRAARSWSCAPDSQLAPPI